MRLAIAEQLSQAALTGPKILLGSYGSDSLARAAIAEAKKQYAMLVICFIRELVLSGFEGSLLTIDTDLAALRVFAKFLDVGHEMGVPILPVYDTGGDAAELMAENAAIYGCEKILIGSSRHGAIYHLIKGRFQQRLEALLPEEIPVQVISGAQSSAGRRSCRRRGRISCSGERRLCLEHQRKSASVYTVSAAAGSSRALHPA